MFNTIGKFEVDCARSLGVMALGSHIMYTMFIVFFPSGAITYQWFGGFQ